MEIKNEYRWNQVLLMKSKRVNDDVLVKYFESKIPKVKEDFNPRYIFRAYQEKVDEIYKGCEMAEMMDGSGDCGDMIWGNIENDYRRALDYLVHKYSGGFDKRQVLKELRIYATEIDEYQLTDIIKDLQEEYIAYE